MAAEISGENIDRPEVLKRPSTAGMTTRVVKGSLWTLLGQVAPLAVSIIATPFTIRLLGAESYGVYILIGLIPNYLGFADFGMSMASTKFGSEAYAEGDQEKEANVVRTAAFIALCSSLPVAAGLMIFAPRIVGLFSVPEHLFADAVFALRLAAITFVVNFLCGIFNTPQLARLRMDLNTAINTIPRMLGLIATPIVIYLGYGIVGAVTVLLAASILNLTGHLIVSTSLIPNLMGKKCDVQVAKQMISFGAPLILSSIAGIVLINAEKGILSALTSSKDLAYYWVAFTLVNMVTMFSGAMVQSLLPAFSQLQRKENALQLNMMFNRGLRINLVWLLPTSACLSLVAKPFFLIWAGPDFSKESFYPFQIMLVGIAVTVMTYIPHVLIIASGRTDLLAKIYWVEVVPYILLVWILTTYFGVIGAAIAWTARVVVDSIFIYWVALRIKQISIRLDKLIYFFFAGGILSLPLLVNFFLTTDWRIVAVITLIVLACYLIIVLHKILEEDEAFLVYKLLHIRKSVGNNL